MTSATSLNEFLFAQFIMVAGILVLSVIHAAFLQYFTKWAAGFKPSGKTAYLTAFCINICCSVFSQIVLYLGGETVFTLSVSTVFSVIVYMLLLARLIKTPEGPSIGLKKAGKIFLYNMALILLITLLGAGAAYIAVPKKGGTAPQSIDPQTAKALEEQNVILRNEQASNADRFKALLKRIELLEKNDYLDKAIHDLSIAIEMAPKAVPLYIERATNNNLLQRYNDAIADYSAAYDLSRDETKWPLILTERGSTYLSLKQLDKAEADFQKALSIDPESVPAIDAIQNLFYAKGDYLLLQQQLDEVLKRHPDDAGWIRSRGNLEVFTGNYSAAIEDFKKSLTLEGSHPYLPLWIHLARLSSGKPDKEELASMTAKTKPEEWPAPLLKYYLGQETEETVMAEAAKGTTETRRNNQCEAHYYIGHLALLQGQKDKAKALFAKSIADCYPRFVEWGAAHAALRQAEK